MGSKLPRARAKLTALSGRLTCRCRNGRCLRGNRREIPDLRLDPANITTAANCQRWEFQSTALRPYRVRNTGTAVAVPNRKFSEYCQDRAPECQRIHFR